MRILITNDDGIHAPGLAVLEAIAAEVAGPTGEVFVVAPAFEQSGVGHCINYAHPTLLSQTGPNRYSAEGSPADCVLAGLHEVMKDNTPDLVLSGVNRGNNSAENVVYSGTVGGAMEGALQGVRSIALSQFYGPGNVELDDQFEAAAAFGADVVRDLIAHGIWKNHDYGVFYNVNFPPVPAAGVKGQRVVAQGWRQETNFSVAPQQSPSGRMFMWVTGGPQHVATAPGTDVAANVDGYISVTPLTADLTLHGALAPLATALDRDMNRS
ncbi:MAG: 5'/3'-nucleotidase SurE [Pseudomonadota bacterium]